MRFGSGARIALPCLAIIIGCKSRDSAIIAACDTAPPLTWESWGAGFFTSYCQPCHSVAAPQRYGAPDGLNFDTEAQVRSQAAAVRLTVLEQASMPVGGGVPEDDLLLLDLFLSCAEGA